MALLDPETTAKALLDAGTGILVVDEPPAVLTRRFDAHKIVSTPDSRLAYRELFFTAPGVAQFVSGVIMHEETLYQPSSTRIPLADLLARQGIIPGLRVDTGAKPLAGSDEERITEGLDGLRDRLRDCLQLGIRYAKWRSEIRIGYSAPSAACVSANAHAMARCAALCQEQGLAAVIAPEVLMDGAHSIEQCEQVASDVLQSTFNALHEQGVSLEGILLSPSMVLAGDMSPQRVSVDRVAQTILRSLRRHVPPAVPGIVFLSAGQDPRTATLNLNAISQLGSESPWKISFAFGRALQDEALRIWQGKAENLHAAQDAFLHRARCLKSAVAGRFTPAMEGPVAA